ncbi:MAG: type II toxin-antitoxin system VapB family antitoxin [Opitutae bacterium]|nr:type II toxin-antitoxin system VapB family antitoxin [Opitutae bacterium]
MKTTIDIQDDLLGRAKRHARKTGRTLRAVVEDGLREVLAAPAGPNSYRLPDLSAGHAGAEDPLEAHSWQDLRGLIYGEAEMR